VTGARPPRVLIAKPGLDGHDRGAKVVAYALRDAGCEVIYLGLRCSAEKIINAALQEDVDVIGISVLSGAHVPLATDLIEVRAAHGLQDIPIVLGGIVTPGDADRLREIGVADVYPAGTPIAEVVSRVTDLVDAAKATEKGTRR
jgi:methylmalonyl-CoA mutase C-terminal domain/subunit